MRIVTAQQIRQEKGQTVGASWDKVLKAKEQFPDRFEHCEFYVQDSNHSKVSAVDRVLRAFPVTQKGLCEAGCGLFGGEARFVTNIPELLNGNDPALTEPDSLHIATEIAYGLPRRFPTDAAFAKLCWSTAIAKPLDAKPTMGNPPTMGKHLGLQVTHISRGDWFTAFVDLDDASPLSSDAPIVPSNVTDVIEFVGGDWWSETILLATDDEQSQLNEKKRIAEDIAERFRLLANRENSPVKLPERLRDEEEIRADTVRSLTDPALAMLQVKNYKTEFARAMRKLGYLYDKDRSQRQHHVAKRGSRTGNTILVVSDIGGHGPPWLPAFEMEIHGLGWKASVPIARQYAVFTNDDWAQMNKNCAAVIQHLEATFVPEIDRLFGPAPQWFTDFPFMTRG